MSRQFKTFDSAQQPLVFDGNLAVCFIVRMTTDVNMARVKNIAPGVLYTFIFHQDGIGQHSFQWPPQCHNAMSIDPVPNSTTVQNFIGDTGGFLEADIPGAWAK